MDKLEKMIKAYNKKAEKWEYETLQVVNGKLIPDVFTPKYNNLDQMGFFKKIKTLYRDGYLQEDFNKIQERITRS